jgi:PadR family transcriptional regulator, regulatory protein AphA
MAEYFELHAGDLREADARAIVSRCVESGARAVLFDRTALPPAFFDLGSGFAGELIQKLTQYGIRMAVVVPDPSRCSRSFQDFVREANRGGQFRFFPDRPGAIRWLESPDASAPTVPTTSPTRST